MPKVCLLILAALVLGAVLLWPQNAPTLTWSVALGELPPGLTLDSATGLISGTPTTPGAYLFVVRVVSNAGGCAVKAYLLQVYPKPVTITTAAVPNADAAKPYSFQLAAQ